MKFTQTTEVDVYRIGWWTHRWWPRSATIRGLLAGNQIGFHGTTPPADWSKARIRKAHARVILRDLKLIRRPHRPWQAEYENCRWARRGWTRDGVRRKAQADQQHMLATGEWSPWIQRKVLRRYGPDAVMGPVA